MSPFAPKTLSLGRRLLLLAAVAAVALYLALTSGGGDVSLRDVDQPTVSETVSEMKSMVDENVR